MNNIYNYSQEQLEQLLVSNNIPKFRSKQIWNWLYIKLVTDIDQMTNLDAKTKDFLKQHMSIPQMEVVKHQSASDGTQKGLLRLDDGRLIETVLMKYKHGYSVCVTTQIGCAVGCSFCASGLQGFTRNLKAGEIVAQVIYWQRILAAKQERVSNVVVMGIGEPFNNYRNTISFIDCINDSNGLNIGARHITISTSGIVPQIYKLAEYPKQVNLAISLHGADDVTRSKIMKINDTYPISELMEAVDVYIERTNRRVSFEYIMLSGVNDSPTAAKALAKLVRHKNCHINLIPYNSVDEKDYKATPVDTINKFVKVLTDSKIQVSVRRANGDDIDGACGQLRHKEEENNA
ncbi:23S rRNA (adenine(2503)-C(2))-methyltransferase RlmN [Mollicutes bacterium LVI A0039]|nr:23S rRNA (adenine(2503)-C(2))-methyltransferase RlmN [Mollicutes bacterium LVI A0039]